MKRILRQIGAHIALVGGVFALVMLQMDLKVNSGNDKEADALSQALGAQGTSTGAAATTLTDSGASWTVNAWAGHIVVAAATGAGNQVYGTVLSNTATVLTIDRWTTASNPGGAAATTPGATTPYVIVPGNGPAFWMALTANATAAGAGDTTLTAEITTGGGGLIRKICPYAHTAGAASYTLTPVFTANGSDTLPVTIAKMGVFDAQNGGRMLFETLVSPTATLSASGDALTLTETVSM